jgi:hypothetical protein
VGMYHFMTLTFLTFMGSELSTQNLLYLEFKRTKFKYHHPPSQDVIKIREGPSTLLTRMFKFRKVLLISTELQS